MEGDDADFGMRFDEIIKVCKILLHKFNFFTLKSAQDTQFSISEMQQSLRESDSRYKSLLEEVNLSV